MMTMIINDMMIGGEVREDENENIELIMQTHVNESLLVS